MEGRSAGKQNVIDCAQVADSLTIFIVGIPGVFTGGNLADCLAAPERVGFLTVVVIAPGTPLVTVFARPPAPDEAEMGWWRRTLAERGRADTEMMKAQCEPHGAGPLGMRRWAHAILDLECPYRTSDPKCP